MKRRNRDISIFSMSALDLFASALGAFILLTIVIFPYFPNVSRVEATPPPVPAPPPEEGAATVEAEIRRRLAEAEERLARAEAEARDVADIRRRLAEAEERQATQFPHLDLVIALDVTGSMGEQVADFKQEVDQLISLLISLSPSLGVGIAAFGDRYWERPVTTFDLREISASPADRTALRSFVNRMTLGMGIGSGSYGSPDDPEEAFLAALMTASRMRWRPQAEHRVIVMITDNPAYPEEVSATVAEAESFAARGDGHRVSTVFVEGTRGTGGATMAFLERVAAAGDGQVVRARGSFTAMLLLSLI